MLSTLALAPWATNLLILVLLGVAVILILTVLIQRPQGGGLSAAFGSAGSGQTAFGTKTGDALTVFTVIMFSVFIFAAIGLNFAMRPSTAPAGTVADDPTGAAPASTPATGTSTPPTTSPVTNPASEPTSPAPSDAPAESSDKPNVEPAAPATTPQNPPTPESAPAATPPVPAPK